MAPPPQETDGVSAVYTPSRCGRRWCAPWSSLRRDCGWDGILTTFLLVPPTTSPSVRQRDVVCRIFRRRLGPYGVGSCGRSRVLVVYWIDVIVGKKSGAYLDPVDTPGTLGWEGRRRPSVRGRPEVETTTTSPTTPTTSPLKEVLKGAIEKESVVETEHCSLK